MTDYPLTRRAFLQMCVARAASVVTLAAALLLTRATHAAPPPAQAASLVDPYTGIVPLTFPIRRGLFWIYNNWHAPRLGAPLSFSHQIRSTLRAHDGVDIFAPRGVALYACASGVVLNLPRPRSVYGNYLWIQNAEGYRFFYCHLDKVYVKAGQKVEISTVVGTLGNTGNAAKTPPHLHFELHYPAGKSYACKHCPSRKRVSALNPYPSLRAASPRL